MATASGRSDGGTDGRLYQTLPGGQLYSNLSNVSDRVNLRSYTPTPGAVARDMRPRPAIDAASRARDHGGMDARLVIIDGYNVILRSNRLKPGPNRTLRESRDKLINLLAWMMGGNNVRFLIVFDGTEDGPGRDQTSGRVLITYSRPPETADDVIARYVDKWIGGDEEITVVTSDIEVARHARAMGAEISLGDLFLASAFGDIGPEGTASGASDEPNDKPTSLSKKELVEWAALFTRRSKEAEARPEGDEQSDDESE